MAGLLGTSEAMPELQGEFGEAARCGNPRRARVCYARYGGAADALQLSLFSGLRPGPPVPPVARPLRRAGNHRGSYKPATFAVSHPSYAKAHTGGADARRG